jgi:beta-lactamase class A
MQNRPITPRPRLIAVTQKRASLRRRRAFFLAVLVAVAGVALVRQLSLVRARKNAAQTVAQAVTSSGRTRSTPSAAISALDVSSPSQNGLPAVRAAITQVSEDHPDIIFGVSVIDLQTNQRTDLGGDQSFIAASTTKLIAASLLLKRVEDGSLHLDDPLGYDTVQYQLEQMVNQSNNDSWAFVNDLLTLSGEEDYAKSIGLTSFTTSTNSVSPNDMALLLKKLYDGELLNKEHTDLLLSYMQNTNEDGLISAAVTNGATVYHKYGELDDNVHDIAIIDDGSHPYVLAIYTNGQGYQDYDLRAQMIQEMTKAVGNAIE